LAWKAEFHQTRFHFRLPPFFHILPGMDEWMSSAELRRIVRAALKEDIGSGDVTSLATVPKSTVIEVCMVAREPMTVCGLTLAEAVFREMPDVSQIDLLAHDGQRVKPGRKLMHVLGSARSILSAERVALNFVQRLSGVATVAGQYVEAVKGTRAKVLDTRKTTPGWRMLEKYAVRCGGARNHRFGLFDMVLIKDNHLAALSQVTDKPVFTAVQTARARYPKLKIEVEADTLDQVRHAVEAGADFILLDNMTNAQLRAAVRLVNGRAKTEASGGVNLKTIGGIAGTGVDFISVGAMTHSARAMDIGLDFVSSDGRKKIR
jgi:nicotinate-nucleotide pyrophosphorylase (carboxylating)